MLELVVVVLLLEEMQNFKVYNLDFSIILHSVALRR